MTEETRHEHYPAWMVTVSALHAIAIPVLGAYVLAGFGLVVAALYLAFCLALEIHHLWEGCRDCYYYGKRCAFGRGLLCATLFRRGDPQRFPTKTLRWRDMALDFVISVVPLIGGVVLSITAFSWARLAALLALAFLFSVGNAYVRGQIACRFCIQKDLGCPAQKLFEKPAA